VLRCIRMCRPGKAAPPEPAVQELGEAQLRDALKYGMIASAAYSNKEDEVRWPQWP
jgi:hypothetical protein